jgi:hypothetical protein
MKSTKRKRRRWEQLGMGSGNIKARGLVLRSCAVQLFLLCVSRGSSCAGTGVVDPSRDGWVGRHREGESERGEREHETERAGEGKVPDDSSNDKLLFSSS